ncbi:hypothetical protein SAMN06264365_104461 [Actinoplanes regularis]|uniref:Uncharacterized protein n=2 Tax=Actinoplanes regularis TaxID=52697 RepID=A0A238YCM9_9ACTN|nr:hypothetical protein Are01nite_24670 [Actinoplanes regularis]SNR69016.1 hypothetical protein SAMN06264365_104461 [Actinoplanes regularis]
MALARFAHEAGNHELAGCLTRLAAATCLLRARRDDPDRLETLYLTCD